VCHFSFQKLGRMRYSGTHLADLARPFFWLLSETQPALLSRVAPSQPNWYLVVTGRVSRFALVQIIHAACLTSVQSPHPTYPLTRHLPVPAAKVFPLLRVPRCSWQRLAAEARVTHPNYGISFIQRLISPSIRTAASQPGRGSQKSHGMMQV
jgi:hypothetical protein